MCSTLLRDIDHLEIGHGKPDVRSFRTSAEGGCGKGLGSDDASFFQR